MPDEKKLLFRNYMRIGLTPKEAAKQVTELNDKLKVMGKKLRNMKKSKTEIRKELNKKFLEDLEKIAREREKD